jgi:hypothetical protein
VLSASANEQIVEGSASSDSKTMGFVLLSSKPLIGSDAFYQSHLGSTWGRCSKKSPSGQKHRPRACRLARAY